MVEGSHFRVRILFARILFTLAALTLFAAPLIQFPKTFAQSAAPVLISHEDSTRAISFESVNRQREPFSTTTPVSFGPDNQTRIMLFVMNLSLQADDTASSISVEAEDAAHHVYQLPVEYLGVVPEHPWASSLVVRLNPGMSDVGDVLVRVSYRGLRSNRVRVAIGHIGGGLPDDEGAVPTPGSA